MKIKNINKIILSTNCRRITITPLLGKMRLCIDGEIIDAGTTQFEICPQAFNFVVPKRCKEAEDRYCLAKMGDYR